MGRPAIITDRVRRDIINDKIAHPELTNRDLAHIHGVSPGSIHKIIANDKKELERAKFAQSIVGWKSNVTLTKEDVQYIRRIPFRDYARIVAIADVAYKYGVTSAEVNEVFLETVRKAA